MEDADVDAEWTALVSAVRAREDLSRAVESLARRHHLDETGAIRRLLWVAVDAEFDLPTAARVVLDDTEERD